jgi:hypothetical protein
VSNEVPNRAEHPAHGEPILTDDHLAAFLLAAMRGAAMHPNGRRTLTKHDMDQITRWAHQGMVDAALIALVLDGAAYPFIDGGELCFHFRDGNAPLPEGTITMTGFDLDDGPTKVL